jgi:plastocyanin
MSKRKFYLTKMAALASLLLVFASATALADTTATDGDTVAGGNNLSATCAAKTVTSETVISFQGSQHFAPNQNLSVSVTPDSPITVSNVPATVSIAAWAAGSTKSFQFDTTVPADTPSGTYKVNVTVNGARAGSGTHTAGDFFNVNVTCSPAPANTVPSISSASFNPDPVDCRSGTTLSVTFVDPDNGPWTASIDWNYDGTTFDVNETKNVAAAGNFTVPHTYVSPGTYTAGVKVADSFSPPGISAVATATVTVDQEYSVTFLQPFYPSNPNAAIINKAKAGRVVPVKVQIYDVCAQESYTDTTAPPSAAVSKSTSANGATTDGLESYADAGASNGNDQYFRWSTDGF